MVREPRSLTYSTLEGKISVIWMSPAEHFRLLIQNFNYFILSSDMDKGIAIENKFC
jgi:hypothetical protein